MMSSSNIGLLLYLHNYSFYAQRVILAMHEKHIDFNSHIVDITGGENYQPWFLDINPRGEVPVLKDGVKIIPDSNRIIEYLEDNFSNGKTPRLIPLDQGNEVKQKVLYFKDLIDKVPANVVTIGCCYHSDLISNPRLPFISPVRSVMKSSDEKFAERLRRLAEKYPKYRDILLDKANTQDKNHAIVSNKEKFLELLGQVGKTLDEVEEQLKVVKDSDWLVTHSFTAADVNLAILLERLSQVGLAERFWSGQSSSGLVRPKVNRYYERVTQRESFKQTIPGVMFHVQSLVGGKGLIIGVVAVAATIGGALFFSKKRR